MTKFSKPTFFYSKALSVLRYLNFCLDFFHEERRLYDTDKVISEFMSQLG